MPTYTEITGVAGIMGIWYDRLSEETGGEKEEADPDGKVWSSCTDSFCRGAGDCNKCQTEFFYQQYSGREGAAHLLRGDKGTEDRTDF